MGSHSKQCHNVHPYVARQLSVCRRSALWFVPGDFLYDNNSNFNAEMEAEIIFGFVETPEEYGKEVMNECVPQAAKALLLKLDDMLIHMDEKQLGLAELI